MLDRRKVYHLGGESLREIGVLLLVFGPLDAFFQREQASLFAVSPFIAAGLILTSVGIIIGAKD